MVTHKIHMTTQEVKKTILYQMLGYSCNHKCIRLVLCKTIHCVVMKQSLTKCAIILGHFFFLEILGVETWHSYDDNVVHFFEKSVFVTEGHYWQSTYYWVNAISMLIALQIRNLEKTKQKKSYSKLRCIAKWIIMELSDCGGGINKTAQATRKNIFLLKQAITAEWLD